MPDIIKNAEDCAREIIEGMGFELVGVDYGREDGLMCLTYYIYSEQGVNIDDCERVSRAIEPAVEEKDPVCGEKYCLCVSSPGERPFIPLLKEKRKNLQAHCLLLAQVWL